MVTTAPIRSGDRVQVFAGRARSATTNKPLAAGCYLDVMGARVEPNGDIEVYGALLTKQGGWRKDVPVRTVILPPGSYATPVRVGDTVHHSDTEQIAAVTAIHIDDAGIATADLLFGDGVSADGHNLARLTHLSRPATEPGLRPCQRRHRPEAVCHRCTQAQTTLTIDCVEHVGTPATVLVAVRVNGRDTFSPRCIEHSDPDARRVPIVAGAHSAHYDGTQVGTCQHCGHLIWAYPATARFDQPWRGHLYDETGRCTADVETRAQTPVLHEPARTIGDLADAVFNRPCGDTSHSIDECPANPRR